MKRVVYHGTHKSFVEHVRDEGLRKSYEGSPGVRVRLDPDEARRDARAYSAAMMVKKFLPPEGMIVVATIDESRLRRDRHDVIRVDFLLPTEVQMRGPIKFPEFGFTQFQVGEPGDLAATRDAVAGALDDFEKLTSVRVTNPMPKHRVRRS